MDPWIRASDADREHTVEVMREQVGTGRLTLDEFSERCAEAYRARTIGELDALTRDLPDPTASMPADRHPVVSAAAILAAVVVAGVLLLAIAALAGLDSASPMMDHMGSMMRP